MLVESAGRVREENERQDIALDVESRTDTNNHTHAHTKRKHDNSYEMGKRSKHWTKPDLVWPMSEQGKLNWGEYEQHCCVGKKPTEKTEIRLKEWQQNMHTAHTQLMNR